MSLKSQLLAIVKNTSMRPEAKVRELKSLIKICDTKLLSAIETNDKIKLKEALDAYNYIFRAHGRIDKKTTKRQYLSEERNIYQQKGGEVFEHALKKLNSPNKLHLAAQHGFNDLVIILLDESNNHIIKDDHRIPALHIAIKSGHTAVVKTLLEKQHHTKSALEIAIHIANTSKKTKVAEMIAQYATQV